MGSGCGAYSTLNLKNAALSSGANSRQMLPSTTDTESGFRVRGANECVDLEWKYKSDASAFSPAQG